MDTFLAGVADDDLHAGSSGTKPDQRRECTRHSGGSEPGCDRDPRGNECDESALGTAIAPVDSGSTAQIDARPNRRIGAGALGRGGSAIARSTATLCRHWLALHATACQRLRVLIMTARMNKSYTVLILLSALSLAACGDRAVDTADSMAKDSERLKVVMRQCRDRS